MASFCIWNSATVWRVIRFAPPFRATLFRFWKRAGLVVGGMRQMDRLVDDRTPQPCNPKVQNAALTAAVFVIEAKIGHKYSFCKPVHGLLY